MQREVASADNYRRLVCPSISDLELKWLQQIIKFDQDNKSTQRTKAQQAIKNN